MGDRLELGRGKNLVLHDRPGKPGHIGWQRRQHRGHGRAFDKSGGMVGGAFERDPLRPPGGIDVRRGDVRAMCLHRLPWDVDPVGGIRR
jgi:hypothetical protein